MRNGMMERPSGRTDVVDAGKPVPGARGTVKSRPWIRRVVLSIALSAIGVTTAQAELQGRDLDGDASSYEAYYDTELDITWLADWNYAVTSGYATGRMRWGSPADTAGTVTANGWIASLNEGDGLYGLTGWRLPTLEPVDGTAFQYLSSSDGSTDRGYAETGVGWGTASELGHLFYVTLGGVASDGLPALADSYFSNVQAGQYWTSVEYGVAPTNAWTFNMLSGLQTGISKQLTYSAVAVYDGDVLAPVPEPGTYAMMLVGLATVGAAARRRRSRLGSY